MICQQTVKIVFAMKTKEPYSRLLALFLETYFNALLDENKRRCGVFLLRKEHQPFSVSGAMATVTCRVVQVKGPKMEASATSAASRP